MNVAIIGAGSIGGWVGAKLALSGNAVTALTSRGPLDRITIAESGSTSDVELRPFDGPADLLVIAVKATALAEAAEAARSLMWPETLVLPMMNGVPWWFSDEPLASADPDGRIAAALPIDQVIGCVVHASCRRPARSRIEVVHAEKLILGEPNGRSSERVAELCRLFAASGIECETSDDVRRAIWYKLWGNATINPLSALTRSTADKLLGDPALRGFMAEAMDELAAIGAAIGCPIAETAEDRMAVTARLGAFKSSMLQDVEAGRSIELEALLGAPREIARRVGIATPQLDRIYALTAALGGSLNLNAASGRR